MHLIESPAAIEHPLTWSRDGAYLLVSGDDRPQRGLYVYSFGTRALKPFVKQSVDEAVFSPDNRYVAYSSFESGRYEVYVTTFPEPGQPWPLTSEGGRVLSWRDDGREILVATMSGHIAVYPVSTEGSFTAGKPAILI